MVNQIYVVSSGEYSDYSIVAILSGANGQDMNALYNTFKYETSRPSNGYNYLGEWSAKLSDEYGLSSIVSSPDGHTWTNHANESALFIKWLEINHSFKTLDYDETNLGFW